MRAKIIAGLLISGILLLLIAGVVLFLWPTVLTGGYCDVTLLPFDILPNGTAVIPIEMTLAYRTRIDISIPTNLPSPSLVADTYARSGPFFFRRPKKGAAFPVYIPLATDAERASPPLDLNLLRRRVILQPGMFRLRWGERLVYYRVTEETGKVFEGDIRVRAIE